ncbi:U3 small nucleolar RNA-associated protein 6, putative, partial [Hepatocystis sp. ex Piliocolobus tephrosceles]
MLYMKAIHFVPKNIYINVLYFNIKVDILFKCLEREKKEEKNKNAGGIKFFHENEKMDLKNMSVSQKSSNVFSKNDTYNGSSDDTHFIENKENIMFNHSIDKIGTAYLNSGDYLNKVTIMSDEEESFCVPNKLDNDINNTHALSTNDIESTCGMCGVCVMMDEQQDTSANVVNNNETITSDILNKIIIYTTLYIQHFKDKYIDLCIFTFTLINTYLKLVKHNISEYNLDGFHKFKKIVFESIETYKTRLPLLYYYSLIEKCKKTCKQGFCLYSPEFKTLKKNFYLDLYMQNNIETYFNTLQINELLIDLFNYFLNDDIMIYFFCLFLTNIFDNVDKPDEPENAFKIDTLHHTEIKSDIFDDNFINNTLDGLTSNLMTNTVPNVVPIIMRSDGTDAAIQPENDTYDEWAESKNSVYKNSKQNNYSKNDQATNLLLNPIPNTLPNQPTSNTMSNISKINGNQIKLKEFIQEPTLSNYEELKILEFLRIRTHIFLCHNYKFNIIDMELIKRKNIDTYNMLNKLNYLASVCLLEKGTPKVSKNNFIYNSKQNKFNADIISSIFYFFLFDKNKLKNDHISKKMKQNLRAHYTEEEVQKNTNNAQPNICKKLPNKHNNEQINTYLSHKLNTEVPSKKQKKIHKQTKNDKAYISVTKKTFLYESDTDNMSDSEMNDSMNNSTTTNDMIIAKNNIPCLDTMSSVTSLPDSNSNGNVEFIVGVKNIINTDSTSDADNIHTCTSGSASEKKNIFIIEELLLLLNRDVDNFVKVSILTCVLKLITFLNSSEIKQYLKDTIQMEYLKLNKLPEHVLRTKNFHTLKMSLRNAYGFDV